MSGFASDSHTLQGLGGTDMYIPYSYTSLILNLCTKYGKVTHQHEACSVYFRIQCVATPYISHSYHSNHKNVSFKKIVHTVKQLPDQLLNMSLIGKN